MRHNSDPNQVTLFDTTQYRSSPKDRSKRRFCHGYKDIISFENLLTSWREFLSGKRGRRDVAEFSLNLMDNIRALHQDLLHEKYFHQGYTAFKICDPKPRDIHKASVRDRLLHHALYRALYPYFDQKFIYDSYSCRNNKGTHRAINRFREYGYKVSRNHMRTAWVLKCDIKKFFANIDHTILLDILQDEIEDVAITRLLKGVIGSFQTSGMDKVGLPLGNLTSQLLVNIYMNELDQFVKRKLKIKHYIRYADDFVILHKDKSYLITLIPQISSFLETRLALSLNTKKLFIKTLASGVDFLGWVHFPHHRVLRTSTKKRMFAKLSKLPKDGTVTSYLGLLSHGNTYKLKQQVLKKVARISSTRTSFYKF